MPDRPAARRRAGGRAFPGRGGCALHDRATWIAFGNKGDHQIAVEGDEALFNQYGVILVNPEKCPNVKAEEGQQAIADFEVEGQQLFTPNAPG